MNEPRIIPVGAEPPPMLTADEIADRCELRAGGKPKEKANREHARDRFAVLNRFVDVTLRLIEPTAAVVWLVLYRDTKANGFARTSQTDIARRTGRSTRTVYRALQQLEKLGLLQVLRQGRINSGPTVYRVRSLGKDDF